MTTETQSSPNHILLIGVQTDVGRSRKHNEDYVGYHRPQDPQKLAAYGTLMVVCDGVGGSAAGEIASETAVRQIIDGYYGAPAKMTVQDRLAEAIQRANEIIYEMNQQRDREMATTVVAAVILDKHLVIAHAGDSRAYLVRGGKIAQLTQDHSWVEEMVRSGDLTPEEARRHPWRNRITRGLGMNPTIKVEVGVYDWQAGDTLILCSDGLTRHVRDDEIAAVVMNYLPREAAQHLIEMANQRGGKDNISVIVARSVPETLLAGVSASEEDTEPTFIPAPPPKRTPVTATDLRRNKLILLVGALILLLLCLGGSAITLVGMFRHTPKPTVTSFILLTQTLSPGPTPEPPTKTPISLATKSVGGVRRPSPTPFEPDTPTPTPVPTSLPSQTPPPTLTGAPTPTVSVSPTITATPSITPTAMSSPTPSSLAIVVPQSGAKLREEQSTGSGSWEYFKLGDIVKVLEPCGSTGEDWCQVRGKVVEGDEKEGWVRGDLLVKLLIDTSASGEEDAFASMTIPSSLQGWDVQFISETELRLATTHRQHKTPLLFRLPISIFQPTGSHSLRKDQVRTLKLELPSTESNIQQGVLAPKGNRFGLRQEGGSLVYVWDLEKDKKDESRSPVEKCNVSQTISTFAFGPEGRRVACGGAFGVVLEKISDDKPRWEAEGTSPGNVTQLAVALRPKEKPRNEFNVIAAIQPESPPYVIYKKQNNKLERIEPSSTLSGTTLSAIALHINADWLVLGSKNGEVLLAKWDSEQGDFQGPTVIPKMKLSKPIKLLRFNKDGRLLAVATENKVVVWRRVTNNKGSDWKKLMERNEEDIRALAISPEDTYLAVLTSNRLRIYHLPSE